ncbi:PREDICTED: protein glass-like isoform X2 [Nicrophorus vespilloides]|nr:PREDICTED: protein glass-like isoform X2 [Nicrophorus vespilloides]
MAFPRYYLPVPGVEPDGIKQENPSELLEDDLRKIREANFYPNFPYPPMRMKEEEDEFKSMEMERIVPKPMPKIEMMDPENPHCKRKPLPLEKCHICKKYFRRMTTHLQKHAEIQQLNVNHSLSCRFCSKVFSNLGNLQIHMRTHTGMKPYVCEVCSKGFAQSCNLTNHMRIHTGERPFKCPHCDRAFSQSGNLTNHIRLHFDQKPFKCHFCDRAFTQSGNLNSHIRNNHKDENHTQ